MRHNPYRTAINLDIQRINLYTIRFKNILGKTHNHIVDAVKLKNLRDNKATVQRRRTNTNTRPTIATRRP